MYKLVCFSVISCITKNTAHELAKAQDPYPLTYQQIPLFRKQCSLCINHILLSIPIPCSSNELFQYGLLFKHSLVRLSCKSFQMLLLSVSTSLILSISLDPGYSCFKTCKSIFVFLSSGFSRKVQSLRQSPNSPQTNLKQSFNSPWNGPKYSCFKTCISFCAFLL